MSAPKAKKPRGKNAPLPAEVALEPGMEWLAPLLAYRNPRRYLSTRQVTQILGSTSSTVHELINADPPVLAAHRVATTATSNGHWKISAATLMTYLWTQHNGTKGPVPPMRATFSLVWTLIHHLPPDALRLLAGLVTARLDLQSAAVKALGLKLPETPMAELKEAAGSVKPRTVKPSAPTQAALL